MYSDVPIIFSYKKNEHRCDSAGAPRLSAAAATASQLRTIRPNFADGKLLKRYARWKHGEKRPTFGGFHQQNLRDSTRKSWDFTSKT